MNVKRFLASSLVALATVVGGAAPAVAHDVVVRSNPADGSTVQQVPTQLELEFSGIPKNSFNTVALSNQDTGKVLFSAEPQLQDQIIRVDIPADIKLDPGNYKIGFQITSSDGHATRGMTTFKVAGATAPTATSEEMVASSSEAPYTNEQFLHWLIAGFIGFVVVVVGIVIAIAKRKKQS